MIVGDSKDICPLCGRQLVPPCNKHHLLPLSQGGKGTETVMMHKICHDKIHAVFSEAALKKEYNTIEALQKHEEMSRFIKWVRKREPEYYDKSVKMKR